MVIWNHFVYIHFEVVWAIYMYTLYSWEVYDIKAANQWVLGHWLECIMHFKFIKANKIGLGWFKEIISISWSFVYELIFLHQNQVWYNSAQASGYTLWWVGKSRQLLAFYNCSLRAALSLDFFELEDLSLSLSISLHTQPHMCIQTLKIGLQFRPKVELFSPLVLLFVFTGWFDRDTGTAV